VGQGALAIVCREGDASVLARLAALEHPESRLAITAERALLAALEGGCQVPIAALARVSGQRMRVKALVANLTGTNLIEDEIEGGIDNGVEDAAALGKALADALLRKGADRILDEIRRDAPSR
jgi:hydroxymethylbilane synthase